MTSNEAKFDIGKWQALIVKNRGGYDNLNDFLSNSSAWESYISQKLVMSLPATINDVQDGHVSIIVNEIPEELRYDSEVTFINLSQHDPLKLALAQGIAQSLETYRRQMIVWIATVIESMIYEFLFTLFCAHPDRMYDYLTYLKDDNVKNTDNGRVSLKEVLSAKSKEELISNLAVRAVKTLSEGGLKAKLRNIEKVAKIRFERNLIASINDLIELRNRIVHEGSNEEVTNDHLDQEFDCIEEFLILLGKFALENDLRYDDPGELLNSVK